MTDPHGVGSKKVEVGIVARDAQTMAEFYERVLGLTFVGDLDFTGGTMRRFIHGDTIVKLVSTAEPPALSNPPNGPAGNASGLRYLTLQVDDVEMMVQRCLGAGRLVPVPAFEFQPGVMVAMVEDPEGNWVELVQAPAAGS